jgi:hypothetical protein
MHRLWSTTKWRRNLQIDEKWTNLFNHFEYPSYRFSEPKMDRLSFANFSTRVNERKSTKIFTSNFSFRAKIIIESVTKKISETK